MKGVYAIFKKDTNECIYVGQSKCIEGRIKRHFNRRPMSDKDWHNVIYKNEQEYYYKVLEECDASIRGERERYYISVLKPKFNKSKGGDFVHDEYPESGKQKLRQYNGINHRGKDFNGKNNPQYGKRWMNDGQQTKIVEPDEIEYHLKNGYKFGRLYFRTKNTNDRRWMNDGQHNKLVESNEIGYHLNNGYKFGRLKFKTKI